MSTVKTTHELTLSLTVTNRAKSAIWYETHFGFKELFSIDEAGWTEMSTNVPGVTLGLGDAEDHAPGNCVPVFGVTDVDASRSALQAAAVKFDGNTVEIEGMVKLATLYDPDNNALMIAQNLS